MSVVFSIDCIFSHCFLFTNHHCRAFILLSTKYHWTVISSVTSILHMYLLYYWNSTVFTVFLVLSRPSYRGEAYGVFITCHNHDLFCFWPVKLPQWRSKTKCTLYSSIFLERRILTAYAINWWLPIVHESLNRSKFPDSKVRWKAKSLERCWSLGRVSRICVSGPRTEHKIPNIVVSTCAQGSNLVQGWKSERLDRINMKCGAWWWSGQLHEEH